MTRQPPAVQRMVDDAAALANTVAWEDFPHGFVVATATLPGRLHGVACGPGEKLVEAHGERYGRGGCVMDPAKYTHGLDDVLPTWVAAFTAGVLHELAHACTSSVPAEATPDDAVAALEHLAHEHEYTAAAAADTHDNRWAVAFAVLCSRAVPFRAAIAGEIKRHVAADVAKYGYTLDGLNAAVGTPVPAGSLRELLAPGGEWVALLDSRLPALDARMAHITAAGVCRPAGVRGVA